MPSGDQFVTEPAGKRWRRRRVVSSRRILPLRRASAPRVEQQRAILATALTEVFCIGVRHLRTNPWLVTLVADPARPVW